MNPSDSQLLKEAVTDRLSRPFWTMFSALKKDELHPQSLEFIQFGLGVRIETIDDNVCWITKNIPSTRATPLTLNEGKTLSLHLNSFYLHSRGLLDNIAWALFWQINPSVAENANPTKVGLFTKLLSDELQGTDLLQTIEECKEWNKELKEKRDPVAHRLPLNAHCAFVDPDSKEHSYRSTFTYSMKDKPIPVYPTLNIDCERLITITQAFIGYLRERQLIETYAIKTVRPS